MAGFFVTLWSLVTPYKEYRNHYFYEKLGYIKSGEYSPNPNSEFKAIATSEEIIKFAKHPNGVAWRTQGDTMKTNELSTCFCTNDVDACREFYQHYFTAKAVFDCGWYINLCIDGNGPTIQFMQPQADMPTFSGAGVMLNFKVDDVDAEHARLMEAGLETAMPLEDHPWGDRGFSVIDPIGNSVYIYSDREPSDEFKQYYKG